MAMQTAILRYSERLGLNTEDVRSLFLSAIRTCYDGNETAFIDDIFMGFVVTIEGKTDAMLYFDDLITAAQ